MTKLLKIAATLAMLAGLGACTVVPPQVDYVGPSVGVVVGPAPYYRPPPVYYPPPAYYPAPRPYWRGYGHGYRHW